MLRPKILTFVQHYSEAKAAGRITLAKGPGAGQVTVTVKRYDPETGVALPARAFVLSVDEVKDAKQYVQNSIAQQNVVLTEINTLIADAQAL